MEDRINNDYTYKGSASSFDLNWQIRKEAHYNHWIKGCPQNQIQLAFRKHWELFSELLGEIRNGRCLEVGCGRGSISSYFTENGFDCTLLDYSNVVLNTARGIFNNHDHSAGFIQGDAMKLPFKNDCFEVVVSIGLLEHFEDIVTPISEQLRILKPDGLFLGYIVPERNDNIQKYFNWVNTVLNFIYSLFSKKKKSREKVQIYRSVYGSDKYLEAIKELNIVDVSIMGMYPLPMISYSPSFPFTLMPDLIERMLVILFELYLLLRKAWLKRNPWICSEKMGQAFLLSFRKK
jgi:ubiquinone/menaquinone biosynthesis C-methylase UbiE